MIYMKDQLETIKIKDDEKWKIHKDEKSEIHIDSKARERKREREFVSNFPKFHGINLSSSF